MIALAVRWPVHKKFGSSRIFVETAVFCLKNKNYNYWRINKLVNVENINLASRESVLGESSFTRTLEEAKFSNRFIIWPLLDMFFGMNYAINKWSVEYLAETKCHRLANRVFPPERWTSRITPALRTALLGWGEKKMSGHHRERQLVIRTLSNELLLVFLALRGFF